MVSKKVKIVDVVKRPWWQRILTVNYWRVTVEEEDGTQHTFNAWGDISNPNVGSLEHSIRNYFRRRDDLTIKAKGKEVTLW